MAPVKLRDVVNNHTYYIPYNKFKVESANIARIVKENSRLLFVYKFSFISTYANILHMNLSIGTADDPPEFGWGAMDLTQNDFIDGLDTVIYENPTPTELKLIKYGDVATNVENKAKKSVLNTVLDKRGLTDVAGKILGFAGIKGGKTRRLNRRRLRSHRSRAKTRKYK
jgi:hypothetical protein